MASKIRLQAIYDMIKPGLIVADIGCDHGLLPIALVKQGKCVKAYACDVRVGPLSRAKEAILEAGVNNQVIPILCDGLSGIQDDVTGVVIAGMGFDTIQHILEQDIDKCARFQQIVVQCNGHVDEFRRWISDHGFTIDDEKIVKDSHYYQLISMHKETSEPLTPQQCLFGIYTQKDPLFKEYWHYIYNKKKVILSQLSPSHENYKNIKEVMDLIEKALND